MDDLSFSPRHGTQDILALTALPEHPMEMPEQVLEVPQSRRVYEQLSFLFAVLTLQGVNG